MRQSGPLAALAILLCLSAAGAQTLPQAADVLFERPQWSAVSSGATLTYRYARTSALDAVFGPNVEDRIRLGVEPSAAAENRTVRVEMFSGERRRAAGPFEDVSSNPALVLFLEHHVGTLARALKANPRYLKNAIRAGLRERATVTPATVEVAGRPLPGWQIQTQPFAEDTNRQKMRGLETLRYVFLVADEVPGAIVSIEAKATASDNVLYSETLTYDSDNR
jgi:hypothetical protein